MNICGWMDSLLSEEYIINCTRFKYKFMYILVVRAIPLWRPRKSLAVPLNERYIALYRPGGRRAM